MAFLPTNASQVQQFAVALYGIQVGTSTMAQVNNDITNVGGLNKALNAYYTASFGSSTTAAVAATVAANLGLTGTAATDAAAYITAVLNGTAASARGEAILSVLNLFSTLTSNATFGTAATAWNTKVAAAVAYTGAADVALVAGVVTGTAFALTTGADPVVGTAGNDSITGSDTTITGLDTIDGGEGADTFTVSDVAGAGADLTLLTVTGVENLVLISAAGLNGGAADVSGWTGLTSAKASLATFAAAQTLTVADTTAAALTGKVAGTASDVTVAGGSTVAVTLNNAVDNSGKTITANGGAATTAVTITQTAATAANMSKVTIADKNAADDTKADTIATVTIDGLKGGVAAINSDALSTLTLANSTKNVTIDNDTAKHALTVNLSKVTGGTIADAVATALTVNTTGTSSGLTLSGGEILTLNLGGTASLSATVTAAKLTTAVITGAGGVTADLSGATVTSIDAAASSGKNAITVDGTAATYVGGSGVDTVTVTAAPTKSIDGGAGTGDIFTWNKDGAYSTNAKVTGFEVLAAGAAVSADALDATGFTGIRSGAVTGAVEFTNVAAGAGLTITAATLGDVKVTLQNATGLSDAVTVTYAADDGFDGSGDTTTIAGVETVTLITSDTDSSTAVTAVMKNKVSLDVAATLNLSGDVGIDLTGSTLTKVATINATGLTLAGDSSALGGATVAFSVTTGNTFTGGAADDIVTLANAAAGKSNTVTAGDGANNITGGTGVDNITTGSGADTIASGGGADVIDAGAGKDSITVGTGLAVITTGTGQDTVILDALNANGNTYATVTDATVGSATTGDKIDFAGLTTGATAAATTLGTKLSLAGTATFADYLNLATTGNAAANTNAVASWFQFGGDTYVVIDDTNADGFTAGADSVVKLTGLLTLTNATVSTADVITLVA
jgi:S-layer protein